MAYQGTADLSEMAKDMSETIINGNWSVAIEEIRKLNGLQAIFLCNCMREHLDAQEIERLGIIASRNMNDNETGFGYISDSQYNDDDET